MKAVLCKSFGPPETLVVEDVADPIPGAGEVVLSVKAAGVNFPDVLMIENKYQVKPPLPFSPGGEAAGVVSGIGPGVDGVKPGDRVMAITGHGALAEQVVVSADRLVAIPAAMDDLAAGAFLFTYATSDHAVRDRGELRAGETMLVLGAAGGVGLAAVEIGKAAGATVIACASSDEKLDVCRAHGADATINYNTEDLREGIKRITADRGVDVVIDPVGGTAMADNVRSLRPRGTIVNFGLSGGAEATIAHLYPFFRNELRIVGSWMGSMAELREGLALVRQGRIKPALDRVLPLSAAQEAHRLVGEARVVGKLALVP